MLSFSWGTLNVSLLPCTKTQENLPKKRMTPWSICDLVLPQGRSRHCRAVRSGMSHGQWSPCYSILKRNKKKSHVAAAAKSLQLCLTLCDPIDGSSPGSPVPGILQARTLEWVAISFSNAWKWKVKVKSLSHVWLLATPWTAAYQAPPPVAFSRWVLEWVAIAFSESHARIHQSCF